jgi:hypothetical protein
MHRTTNATRAKESGRIDPQKGIQSLKNLVEPDGFEPTSSQHPQEPEASQRTWWSQTGSNRRHRKTLKNLRHREGPGGARRVRTDDLKLAKLPLSQLSYGPILDEIRASARAALGLATLRVDKPSCQRFASPTGRRRSLAGKPRERTFPPAFEASQKWWASQEWWAWDDSNVRPHPYQGCALTT